MSPSDGADLKKSGGVPKFRGRDLKGMITTEFVTGLWDGYEASVGGTERARGRVGAEDVGYVGGRQAIKSFKNKQEDLKIDSVASWMPVYGGDVHSGGVAGGTRMTG